MRSLFFRAPKAPMPLTVLWSDGERSFARALVDGVERLRVEGGREIVLACVRGSCRVAGEFSEIGLGPRDIVYAAGPAVLEVAGEGCLIVAGEGPSQQNGVLLVRRAGEQQPLLVGAEGYRRWVYTLLSAESPSTSLMAGFTEGFPGEWTSFPPHKHDDKVELYTYYGMGGSFGVQIVEDEEGEDAYVVRDGDSVVILRGYHPNAAAPGSRICYVWILCQVEGRKSMTAEVKPGFESLQTGTSHLTLRTR